jgi:hypothetical protein
MASPNVTCAPTCSLKQGNERVPAPRKVVKKINIDLATVSRILNASSEIIDNRDNRIKIINIINNISIATINITTLQDEVNNNCVTNCTGDETPTAGEEETCDDDETGKCGYYYRNRNKKLEYQKKYNREQGDKIKNYNKDYYQKRREEILEKAKTKIICDCGCEVQLFNMNSHKKTKKHARALEQRKKEL